MDQREENLLARLHNVGRYLTKHAGVVSGVVALAGAAAAYAAYLNKLPTAPEAAVDATASGTPTGGATAAKAQSRTALVAPATAMLNALRLYFRAQYTASGAVADQQAAAEMTLNRPADLKDGGMPTGQLQRLLGRALTHLAALPAGALSAYNHDDAKITRFRALAEQFGAVTGAPREARDEAKTLGETVATTLKAARDYIKTDLLPAVSLLADDDAEFVKGFRQANKQDDRRGGQAPRKPKPGADTPPA